MSLVVAFRGGSRFDIQSGPHAVVTDQPVEDGGADAGMSPVDLFMGSLAACVGYFVGRYCARHHLASEGLSIEADWTMAEQPHRVGSVTMAIHFPADVPEAHRERLLKMAYACTVHQSLAVPPRVAIELVAGPVAPKPRT